MKTANCKLLLPTACCWMLLLLAGCAKETSPEPQHDYLVQANVTTTLTKEIIKNLLQSQGYGQYAPLMQSNVRTVRIVYATEYPKGTKLHVSGVLLISENYDSHFPVVILNHGTSTSRNSAPSVEMLFSQEVSLGAAIASAFHGAVLVPDYIGYGESKTVTHPYMHGESLGQTGLDFIRACREYVADPAVALPFNSHIFIAGYSEGGYAAVALHKTIDAHPEEGLEVVKNVAGAGAYDMLAFTREIFDNPNPLGAQMISSYLWVLGTYKTEFQYAKPYAAIFSAADNASLQSINYAFAYDGAAGLSLHETSSELFHPEFISGVRDGSDTGFIRISQQNSFLDFVPKDSLIFVYGDADTWVYPVNSVNACNAISANGGKVNLYMQPGGTHDTTLPLYIEVVLSRLMSYN
jgi:hypothetical protein